MKKYTGTIIGKLLLTILLVSLPVIPVWRAPVIPNPIYELAWISLLQILGLYWLVGVRYGAEWYSYVFFLAVVTLIVLVWRGKRQ